ncbi:MAG TPA: peptide chain release factor-like protein, partial [Cyclobacteriaceae bacterium]|nr:peptide chain release factor-like protein [Cyclobacteriaceae bacterium]
MNIAPPSIEEIIYELEFASSRSSGPGGQNVNKVNSKVTLKWDVVHSSIAEEKREVVL